MNDKDRLKKIEQELKKSADKLFREKPDAIKKELEKETYLGSTKNLAEPTNREES